MMSSWLGLDPAHWQPHPLHDADRTYVETNCYLDILIELVAALGGEPVAMLGVAAAVDFEHDQWTFLKPDPADLRRLYGLDVHEMQPYRSLPLQLEERVAAREGVVVELDSFHLPDTAPHTYRREHVKSSVVVESIDVAGERMRYFHNAVYTELEGADFRAALRVDVPPGSAQLPPYTEVVRRVGDPLTGQALRQAAGEILARSLSSRPADNPVAGFGTQLAQALPALVDGELATYHAYAFATARMAGSSFELLASHVRWLYGEQAEPAARSLDQVVAATKLLVFRLARRRVFDVDAVTGPMAGAWHDAMEALDELVAPALSVAR